MCSLRSARTNLISAKSSLALRKLLLPKGDLRAGCVSGRAVAGSEIDARVPGRCIAALRELCP